MAGSRCAATSDSLLILSAGETVDGLPYIHAPRSAFPIPQTSGRPKLLTRTTPRFIRWFKKLHYEATQTLGFSAFSEGGLSGHKTNLC
jgi:hypothetical protein